MVEFNVWITIDQFWLIYPPFTYLIYGSEQLIGYYGGSKNLIAPPPPSPDRSHRMYAPQHF